MGVKSSVSNQAKEPTPLCHPLLSGEEVGRLHDVVLTTDRSYLLRNEQVFHFCVLRAPASPSVTCAFTSSHSCILPLA